MILPKWGTLFTYGNAEVIKILFLPSTGVLRFGMIFIFWALNDFVYYGVAMISGPLPYFISFYFFLFLPLVWFAIFCNYSYSFFFFFASTSSFFSSFLSCCFDKPILSPSESVSGSFAYNTVASSATSCFPLDYLSYLLLLPLSWSIKLNIILKMIIQNISLIFLF